MTEIKNDDYLFEKVETDFSDTDEDDEFDHLIVRESYCMACESPLRSYQSLICSDCLNYEANMLSKLINSRDVDISKFVTTIEDPNHFPEEDEISEPEVIEEEADDEDDSLDDYDDEFNDDEFEIY
jgi:hypothetical protein